MTRVAIIDGVAWEAVLRRMQLAALPGDVPASTLVGWWWIARSNEGEPVGFAGLYRSTRWSDAGYLCRAGVARAFRGRGIQRRLIAARQRKAASLGMRWLITDTRDNPASANSLIGAGFRMFTPSVPWAADGALYWRKQIA